ncbi:hypothetical protein Ddc_12769 [Ditylenchus destructor]|nr:hypothetical protein Ddc_12769 [Ditylenchus destructor]
MFQRHQQGAETQNIPLKFSSPASADISVKRLGLGSWMGQGAPTPSKIPTIEFRFSEEMKIIDQVTFDRHFPESKPKSGQWQIKKTKANDFEFQNDSKQCAQSEKKAAIERKSHFSSCSERVLKVAGEKVVAENKITQTSISGLPNTIAGLAAVKFNTVC